MESPEDGAVPRAVGPEIGATPETETAAARTILEQVCLLLVEPAPENLDRSAELLADAVTRLTRWRASLPANPAHRSSRQAEIRQLRTSLARARRLLEAAALFHAEWVRCAGALCAGYTRCGEPGMVAHHSRVWAQG